MLRKVGFVLVLAVLNGPVMANGYAVQSARPVQVAVKPVPRQQAGQAGVFYANSATGFSVGTIELFPDGRYVYKAGSVEAKGRYVVSGESIRFDGQLSAWDGGNAEFYGTVIRFAWREDGVNLEYRFRKAE